MVDGCNEIAGDRHFEDMAEERDRAIVAILKSVRQVKGETS